MECGRAKPSRRMRGRLVAVYGFLLCALVPSWGCGDAASPTAPTATRPMAVTVDQDDPHGDARDAATPVGSQSTTQGSLETQGDVDYFRFTVSLPGRLTAETTGNTDTFGQLESADGLIIASADDGGSGANFRIEHQLRAGTYYVRISGSTRAITGSYSLLVGMSDQSDVPDPQSQDQPDLVVYGVSVSTSPSGTSPGGSFELSAGVRNDGVRPRRPRRCATIVRRTRRSPRPIPPRAPTRWPGCHLRRPAASRCSSPRRRPPEPTTTGRAWTR